MSINITYNTSTESNITREFSTSNELKSFISDNKTNFTGAMKVVCDNSITDCNYMFYDCQNLTSLDLSEFDTSNVTNMRAMFYNCQNLTSLDLNNFNTTKVTNMQQMFSSCKNLVVLNINSFNTSNVTRMDDMFQECEKLTSLNLSSFDTNKVTDMDGMFEFCGSLTLLDLSNFDTSKITDMNRMFYYCKNLTSLDISNFNTSNVTNMNYMFEGCSKLTSLNLSSFDTSKVINMRQMFHICYELTTIYCEQDWNNKAVTDSNNMFLSCTKLKGAISYNSSKRNINYANPDTGYFSYPLGTGPSRKFLVNLNMDQNEIKNMLLDKRNTTPDSPAAGQIYYNTTDKKIYVYNGTEWTAGSGFKSSLNLIEAQPYESPEVI